MNRREAFQAKLISWYTAMVAVGKAMPDSEMRELLEWEARNLDGCKAGTSDWPGWENILGQSRPRPTSLFHWIVADTFT
jgi:hypothetical protein